MTAQDESDQQGVSTAQRARGRRRRRRGHRACAASPSRCRRTPPPARGSPVGPRGSTVVEFRGRITQTGSAGQAVHQLRLPDARDRARSRATCSTRHRTTSRRALITAFATGDLRARVLDQSVHSLDIVGTMTLYQRRAGGADFATRRRSRSVARSRSTTSYCRTCSPSSHPMQGIPTLTGDMVQTRAEPLHGPLAGKTVRVAGSPAAACSPPASDTSSTR